MIFSFMKFFFCGKAQLGTIQEQGLSINAGTSRKSWGGVELGVEGVGFTGMPTKHISYCHLTVS